MELHRLCSCAPQEQRLRLGCGSCRLQFLLQIHNLLTGRNQGTADIGNRMVLILINHACQLLDLAFQFLNALGERLVLLLEHPNQFNDALLVDLLGRPDQDLTNQVEVILRRMLGSETGPFSGAGFLGSV